MYCVHIPSKVASEHLRVEESNKLYKWLIDNRGAEFLREQFLDSVGEGGGMTVDERKEQIFIRL